MALAIKHIARVFSGFQTHNDRCRFGTETVRGGRGLGGRAWRMSPSESKLLTHDSCYRGYLRKHHTYTLQVAVGARLKAKCLIMMCFGKDYMSA